MLKLGEKITSTLVEDMKFNGYAIVSVILIKIF